MPPSDYKQLADHGHHAALAGVLVLAGLRARLKAWWSRLFNRGKDSVEAHKFVGFK